MRANSHDRHDFPPAVHKQLRERSGNRCSICEKATSGPGQLPGSIASDGVAAHITAASPGGPRYAPNLTEQQRRSADNGIWACTHHARDIDSPGSSYSVECLKGLKLIREARAARDLKGSTIAEDHTGRLIELPTVRDKYELFDVVTPLPNTYSIAQSTRQLVSECRRQDELLRHAATLLAETIDSGTEVPPILATLLSGCAPAWRPSRRTLRALEAATLRLIKADDWSKVATLEPLSYALAAKAAGKSEALLLRALVNDRAWRMADAQRTRRYYERDGSFFAALFRHWEKDPPTLGKTNDAPRILSVLLDTVGDANRPRTRAVLLDLLENHVHLLANLGEPDLAHVLGNARSGLQ